MQNLDTLIATVQRNCAISDARHAGNYSLCIYLLKMRELFRWESRLGYDVNIKPDDVGDWLDSREQYWDELEEESANFQPIKIDDQEFDAFDSEAINQYLLPQGLVYGAGYGRFGKPGFFLARLQHWEQTEAYTLYIAGEEYARDLVAYPAMALPGQIYVRRESLRRHIWEQIEQSRWQKGISPIKRALDSYHFDESDLDSALDTITDHEIEATILHEIGELIAADTLGDAWNEMLLTVSGSKAEIIVRAVRDHLADCSTSLPALLYEQNLPSLHFYFANLQAMRKELFPALPEAYQRSVQNNDFRALKTIVRQGRQHWQKVAERMIEYHRRYGIEAGPRIEADLGECRC